eukprot:7152924-Lingulodinium_polyedra.AAC.1
MLALKTQEDQRVAAAAAAPTRRLLAKDFVKTLDKFSGKEEDWVNWEFDVVQHLAASCPQVKRAFEILDTLVDKDATVTGHALETDPAYKDEMKGMQDRAKELFDLL